LSAGALPEGWVPGEGDRTLRVMIVGEAPGKEEWKQKRPFVGRTGRLILRPALEAAGIDPATVYITNTVKIWPTKSDGKTTRSPPNPSEIAAALPYLIEEIHGVSPKCILALGNVAHETLTGSPEGVTSARLNPWRKLEALFRVDAQVFSSFHPAHVARLRGTDAWKDWHDDLAKFARRCYGG
jgi:uracil-DNA glycosylase